MGRLSTILLTVVWVVGWAGAVAAATPREQRAEIGQIARQARLAQRWTRSGDLEQASAALQDAVSRLDQLAGDEVDAELDGILRRAVQLVTKAHDDLSAAGLEMPWYRLPAKFPIEGPSASVRGEGSDVGVSFARQVAPMLLSKCGRCHVGEAEGGFSMVTYAALMRGSTEGGRVLVPGGAEGSVIIDLIESGDMPRGGGQVTSQELALLSSWIDQGARFDGPSPETPLQELAATVGNASRSPQSRPAVTLPTMEQATGMETVRFALEIAPVLSAACLDCHGNENPRGRLNLTTMARLLQGGGSGPIVIPGDPAGSVLVQRLRGEGGDRMPLNRDPLPPAAIAKIETWIREGARFDGANPADTLARTHALARAETADEPELNRMREELAARNWRLAIPDEPPQRTETPRFLVVGNLPKARLDTLAELAEAQMETVANVFQHPGEQPLVKSRLTVFAVKRRFDYSEFGTMVERREMPDRWRGHWGYDGVDAYLVVYPSDGDEFSNEVLLGQQIAGVYVSARSRGRAPRWLVEGAARAAAARVDRRDPRVRAWHDALPPAFARQKQPDDFMTGKLSLEDEGVLAYAFVDRLLTKPGRFQQLLNRLADGTSLDESLTKSYGASASQLAGAWARSVARAR